jgi:steroid delta-isomerase-like uncharacterized protein
MPVNQQWLAAYGAHDAAAMAALYTPDAIYEDVPNQFMAKGPEIAKFLATAEQGFADVRLDVRHGFGTDAGAFVEYDYHATNNGMIPGPSVGTSFVSRAVTVFELDGGKIRRSADYYDLVAIMTQLGMMPPMGPAQGPVATPAS